MFIHRAFIPESSREKLNIELRITETGCISLGDQSIDLSCRPLTKSLFDFFLKSDRRVFERVEVTEQIYGITGAKSARLARSLEQNTIKLISRSRKLAQEYFGSNLGSVRIRWFPYDHEMGGYKLYEAFLPPANA